MTLHQFTASQKALPLQPLPPHLQRVVRLLCDTYETLDLQVETALSTAENDFIAALPEMEGHEIELRQLVQLLIYNLRRTVAGLEKKRVLLHLMFRGEGDLTRQVLSLIEPEGSQP